MAAPSTTTLLRPLRCILSRFRHQNSSFHGAKRLLCTAYQKEKDGSSRDPVDTFIDPRVQDILHRVTDFNLDKIFKVRPTQNLTTPQYQLLTDQQLEQVQETALKRGKQRIQMPPYLRPRVDNDAVISDDPVIDGYDDVKYVFTDITYGKKQRERLIVVREPNGLLRHATWRERDRMDMIYFPPEGRMHRMPRMFTEERLEKLLSARKHEYVLDRACVQFEPDDPEYIRITHRTYEHIESEGLYDHLHSTRHFGTMTFYLAVHQKLHGLLTHKIQSDNMTDAGHLVRLHNIVHPDSKCARATAEGSVTEDVDLVKVFAASDGKKSSQLELAIQTYLEAQNVKSANNTLS